MDQFLKINRIFVEDWIQRLIQETNNLSRHALIPKMLQKPNEIELMLKQALHKVHSSSERAIMRVFVDNGQRYDLLEKLRNTPYKMNEDLEKWIIKTIGKDEYTVTFNGITKWNDDMHIALMNEIIQPIVENIGVPYAGVDTYAFIANAGYTPFGIHDDRDHSLIFHLGPSVKHCWIWPRSLYIELTGNDNRRFDPESLKKYGEFFVLEPGDLLFIPKGDFHVFQNVGYSIFLGFILFPSNAEVIGREAIITLAALNGNVEESFVSQDSLEKRMYEQLDVLLGQERDNAYDVFRLGALYSHMLLKSNGYIIHKPIIRSVDLNRMKIEKLRRPNCFPILYHCRGERVTLFIRGRLIDMINVPGLLESINVINSKEQHKYDELLQNISLYLSEDIANWLLKQLISYGGLFLDN